MTSNLGTADLEHGSLGFDDGNREEDCGDNDNKDYEAMKEKILRSMNSYFRPEFLNRLDETIVFRRLGRQDIRKIVDLELEKGAKLVREQGITIQFDDKVRQWLAKNGFSATLGARPLRRLIQKEIENKVSDGIISGEFLKGSELLVSVVGSSISVSLKTLKTKQKNDA